MSGPRLVPEDPRLATASERQVWQILRGSVGPDATVLAGFVPAWRVPLYALAVAIAWSRVYVGAHYPLDLLAGAVLGTASGLAVLALVRALRRRGAGPPRSRPAPPPG